MPSGSSQNFKIEIFNTNQRIGENYRGLPASAGKSLASLVAARSDRNGNHRDEEV